MMFSIQNVVLAFVALAIPSSVSGFLASPGRLSSTHSSNTIVKAAESEVSFGTLDGKDVRIGIIRTRWNSEHVGNLVAGCRKALKECNVKEENIFETEVPGSFELPLAARFLALTGTVDAIVTAGVLIKGDTLHFEYISESVASGLMSVGLNTQTPVVYGVLNCLTEDQVKARSSGDSNHGYSWGKTAVEMALLRFEALNIKPGAAEAMKTLGFGKAEAVGADSGKKKAGTFF